MSQREPFYEVREEAYLFRKELGRPVKSDDAEGKERRQQPEEEVRQWCAHEMIRCYGIRIDEIEFERQVRVGSKRYRIDILALRHGTPWAVIECKKRADCKPMEGMEQAISYAGAEDIRALFAVYTNGDHWHVRRRVGEHWLVVPDLPHRGLAREDEPLTETFRALHAAAPLFHKLNEPLKERDAEIFLGALQSFLNSGNRLLDGTDPDLRFAADNLLRVLAGANHHENYRLSKLSVACQSFEQYRERISWDTRVAQVHRDSSVAENCRFLNASLMCLLEGSAGIVGPNLLLLRLSAALSEYGLFQRPPDSSFPAIPPNLHGTLRDFLHAAVAINMNAQMPDELDRILTGDLKDYCEFSWQQLERGRQSPFWEAATWLTKCTSQRFRAYLSRGLKVE